MLFVRWCDDFNQPQRSEFWLFFWSTLPCSSRTITVSSKMAANWKVTCVDEEDGMRTVTATSVADPTVQHSDKLRVLHGVPMMGVLTPERFDYLNANVTYKAGDIIVVSYPKCGTTWTEQCVLLLLNQGNNDLMDPSNKNTYIPGSNILGKIWPEATIHVDPASYENTAGLEFQPITLEDFDTATSPRVIKSHARAEQLIGCNGEGLSRIPEGVKVLVVSRNPLDACVSSYYHAFNPYKCGWSFEAWAAVWLEGQVRFGSYFEWVRDWHRDILNHPTRGMWLQYEDMQRDPRGQIEQIAAYLGIPVTPEIVDKVLHFSSFDAMKASAAAKGGDHNGHLRQGKSGDWRNHFTAPLVADFRAKYNAELAGTGITYGIGEGEGEEPFTA